MPHTLLGVGGWPTAPCLPPACWLVELAGFVHTGMLVVCAALCAVRPGGVRRTRVGSTVPSPASGGGAWIRPPDGERIHIEYPSIHLSIHPSIHTYRQTYRHTDIHMYIHQNLHGSLKDNLGNQNQNQPAVQPTDRKAWYKISYINTFLGLILSFLCLSANGTTSTQL